ncbi:MAG: hypothetical protein Q7T80_14995 [Methanoregula sp.]|nr:hypothetical protein [Methanoregula sp.]
MQTTSANEPLRVTQEAVEAYEKRTGFYGIGKIMVEDGHWKIVTKEELARSRAQERNNRIATLQERGTA